MEKTIRQFTSSTSQAGNDSQSFAQTKREMPLRDPNGQSSRISHSSEPIVQGQQPIFKPLQHAAQVSSHMPQGHRPTVSSRQAPHPCTSLAKDCSQELGVGNKQARQVPQTAPSHSQPNLTSDASSFRDNQGQSVTDMHGGYIPSAATLGQQSNTRRQETSSSHISAISGFHNIKPRTRAERRAMADREQVEKNRLAQRKEGFQRINVQDSGTAMTSMHPSAAGYMTDADRFHTDVAGEEKQRREILARRKQQVDSGKRTDGLRRDEERWIKMEQQRADEETRWAEMRASGDLARNNKSSVPFDVVSLQYHDGKDGDRLKYADQQVFYRAAIRAKNLHDHTVGDGINPLTGDQPYQVQLPQQPIMPESLRGPEEAQAHVRSISHVDVANGKTQRVPEIRQAIKSREY